MKFTKPESSTDEFGLPKVNFKKCPEVKKPRNFISPGIDVVEKGGCGYMPKKCVWKFGYNSGQECYRSECDHIMNTEYKHHNYCHVCGGLIELK